MVSAEAARNVVGIIGNVISFGLFLSPWLSNALMSPGDEKVVDADVLDRKQQCGYCGLGGNVPGLHSIWSIRNRELDLRRLRVDDLLISRWRGPEVATVEDELRRTGERSETIANLQEGCSRVIRNEDVELDEGICSAVRARSRRRAHHRWQEPKGECPTKREKRLLIMPTTFRATSADTISSPEQDAASLRELKRERGR